MSNTEMKTTDCCVCGVEFSMTKEQYDQRHDDGEYFYCPNGHSQHFIKSRAAEIKKLKTEINNLKISRQYWIEEHDKRRDEIDHLEHVICGYKGYIARLKTLKRLEG